MSFFLIRANITNSRRATTTWAAAVSSGDGDALNAKLNGKCYPPEMGSARNGAGAAAAAQKAPTEYVRVKLSRDPNC